MPGGIHEPFRYGYFSVLRFLREGSQRKRVEGFHIWYVQKCAAVFLPNEAQRRLNRPSVIAHSFGSYVVGESMLKYRELKFDKIILCGSILPAGRQHIVYKITARIMWLDCGYVSIPFEVRSVCNFKVILRNYLKTLRRHYILCALARICTIYSVPRAF